VNRLLKFYNGIKGCEILDWKCLFGLHEYHVLTPGNDFQAVDGLRYLFTHFNIELCQCANCWKLKLIGKCFKRNEWHYK